MQRDAGRAGLTTDDLDWIVPQNTNDKAWQILARLLGVDHGRGSGARRCPTSAMSSPPTTSSTCPCSTRGIVGPGQHVLLTMAGFGLNWQGAVLEVA